MSDQDPRHRARAFVPVSRAPLRDAPADRLEHRSGSWRPTDDELRAWARRLLPSEAEAEIHSRCALFDRASGHARVVGLDRAAYELGVRLWTPLRQQFRHMAAYGVAPCCVEGEPGTSAVRQEPPAGVPSAEPCAAAVTAVTAVAAEEDPR